MLDRFRAALYVLRYFPLLMEHGNYTGQNWAADSDEMHVYWKGYLDGFARAICWKDSSGLKELVKMERHQL